MLDVYFGNMDGVEVHAETPEEEQEAEIGRAHV